MLEKGILANIVNDVINDQKVDSVQIAFIVSIDPFCRIIDEQINRCDSSIPTIRFSGSSEDQIRWSQFQNSIGSKISSVNTQVIIVPEGLVIANPTFNFTLFGLGSANQYNLGFYLFYDYSRNTFHEIEDLYRWGHPPISNKNIKFNIYSIDGLHYSRYGQPDPSIRRATCQLYGQFLSDDPECENCNYRGDCRGNKFKRKTM